MTRGGVLPSEDVVARIESDFPRSKAAALARIVRARIRLNAKDFAGAASLLDAERYPRSQLAWRLRASDARQRARTSGQVARGARRL